MQLIADSGSTKVDWRAICNDGSVIQLSTEGINPVFLSEEYITNIFKEHLLPVFGEDVDEIFFYGAGVVSPEISAKLDKCFKEVFKKSTCVAASDILAAARALCGHKPGIACILGTGSNSCFYDGKEIAMNVKAGGFILGDEASGAYLGKRLISDFIKGLLPSAIETEFKKRYGLDYPAIVQQVYKEQLPSRFLASFSPFINDFKNHPHIANILKSSFDEFFRRNIIHYDYKKYEINFVGSIAYYYKDILEKTISLNGMRMGIVLKSPIEGLVEYHKEEMYL
ncbi:MAG: ATPase [Bacteroidales bacterium]|jgi:N-acetylglucosamine kinase-like BadF-type ATPase